MLEPIHIENDCFIIHSFRADEMKKMSSIAGDVFGILSDEQTLKFLPEKRLHTLQDAEVLLKTSLLNFHAGLNYLHFISDKASGRVIGLIDIISPGKAEQHYSLSEYPYFIEFYLKGDASQRRIMSTVLPMVVKQFRRQGIKQMAAVVNRGNTPAQKVLKRSGFKFSAVFDPYQDLYTVPAN